ncbi:unnamed protein product [Lepeophtheirus salmonis]|uniref:(salmon louse) hypothetical protein n=1 Tax=Lepeophtheirus salmonis TaxID=72036 RepID=A0A7R8GYM2_LEPSM|nr:unnamed protein product [Lepeophtheirus salmonis]CAF2750340.1 unnamed protein product [Lepeophtheirus salmonis]
MKVSQYCFGVVLKHLQLPCQKHQQEERKLLRKSDVPHWPKQDYSGTPDISLINVELNKKSVVTISKTENDILHRFEIYWNLIHFVHLCHRWVTRKSHHSNSLSSEELKDAEVKILRKVQSEGFPRAYEDLSNNRIISKIQ